MPIFYSYCTEIVHSWERARQANDHDDWSHGLKEFQHWAQVLRVEISFHLRTLVDA